MTTYNMVAVGPPESGKTAFLAALYNALASERLATGLFVTLDRDSHSWLNGIYQQIADPSTSWPPGTDPTRPMREVVISFAVQRARQPLLFGKPRIVQYPAFHMTYVDYAGEWLIESHRQDPALTTRFKEHLEAAHVVLCFLDGHRLLQLLRGSSGKKTQRMLNEFRFTMRSCRDAKRKDASPVIVVLTKWDLVEKKYTLGDVSNVLKDWGLTELADAHSYRRRLTHRPQGGIWLVPVSATGSSFAREASDGTVEKTGYGAPEPRNILVPLSLGVVDISDMALDQYRKANTPTPGWVGALRGFVLGGAVTVSGMPAGLGLLDFSLDIRKAIAFSGDLSITAIQLLAWPTRLIIQLVRRRVRRIRARGPDGVSSHEGALIYVGIAFRDKKQESASPGYKALSLWSDKDRLQFR